MRRAFAVSKLQEKAVRNSQQNSIKYNYVVFDFRAFKTSNYNAQTNNYFQRQFSVIPFYLKQLSFRLVSKTTEKSPFNVNNNVFNISTFLIMKRKHNRERRAFLNIIKIYILCWEFKKIKHICLTL